MKRAVILGLLVAAGAALVADGDAHARGCSSTAPGLPGYYDANFSKGREDARASVEIFRASDIRSQLLEEAFRVRLRRHFCLDGQALRTVITSWCGSDGRSTAGAERAVDSILNNLM